MYDRPKRPYMYFKYENEKSIKDASDIQSILDKYKIDPKELYVKKDSYGQVSAFWYTKKRNDSYLHEFSEYQRQLDLYLLNLKNELECVKKEIEDNEKDKFKDLKEWENFNV